MYVSFKSVSFKSVSFEFRSNAARSESPSVSNASADTDRFHDLSNALRCTAFW